jgi:hypothetical protein
MTAYGDARDMFPKRERLVDINEYRAWVEHNAAHGATTERFLIQLYVYMVDRYESEMWDRSKEEYNHYEDKLVAAEDTAKSLREELRLCRSELETARNGPHESSTIINRILR